MPQVRPWVTESFALLSVLVIVDLKRSSHVPDNRSQEVWFTWLANEIDGGHTVITLAIRIHGADASEIEDESANEACADASEECVRIA